ncbi:MAG: TGS domain-containing protein, partial [Planctomycetota bacterium]|nr:TGS domain-containing protein [Planctomycetota bacterium]
MPKITLPDGSAVDYGAPVTALKVAEDIGPGLARAALGCKVNGRLSDLDTTISDDAELAIVTSKTSEGDPNPDALNLLRHSCAHVMAEAIQRVVPEALLVYGPPLDNGFYYDIAFPDDRPLSSTDFEAIEGEMKAIIKDDRPFTRYELA